MSSNRIEIMENRIEENYHRVLENIHTVASRCGRNRHQIKLIVVTKGQPIEKIRQVIEAGATHLGENYAEEGVEKMEQLKELSQVEWHMIGHVQSRKAELVARYYDVIHSIDSLKLAMRIEKFASTSNKVIPTLLEFNVSGEESKFGFPAWDSAQWFELLPTVEEICKLPHLDVRGLMTMAPLFEDPEKARPIFRQLVNLQSFLRKEAPFSEWSELSMGMSSDYEIAIEEGATMVRIGQAIMGERFYC